MAVKHAQYLVAKKESDALLSRTERKLASLIAALLETRIDRAIYKAAMLGDEKVELQFASDKLSEYGIIVTTFYLSSQWHKIKDYVTEKIQGAYDDPSVGWRLEELTVRRTTGVEYGFLIKLAPATVD